MYVGIMRATVHRRQRRVGGLEQETDVHDVHVGTRRVRRLRFGGGQT